MSISTSLKAVPKEADSLSRHLLQEQRQYVIDKVNLPMLKTIISLASRLKKEATKQNTFHPNTHVLIDAFDEFFQTEDIEGREPLLRAMKKIIVDKHESDPWYRDKMNHLLELLVEAILRGEWKPRPLDNSPRWGVDATKSRGIGYEFIKDRYYHGRS